MNAQSLSIATQLLTRNYYVIDIDYDVIGVVNYVTIHPRQHRRLRRRGSGTSKVLHDQHSVHFVRPKPCLHGDQLDRELPANHPGRRPGTCGFWVAQDG